MKVNVDIQYHNQNDKDLGGRGTVDGKNPFTFHFDLTDETLTIIYDNHAEPTCNRTKVGQIVRKQIQNVTATKI